MANRKQTKNHICYTRYYRGGGGGGWEDDRRDNEIRGWESGHREKRRQHGALASCGEHVPDQNVIVDSILLTVL